MAKTFEQEKKEYFAEMGRRLKKLKTGKGKSTSPGKLEKTAKKTVTKNKKKK